MSPELRGLYAITSEALCRDDATLDAGVAAAIAGGARLLQYRDKRATPSQRLARAARLQRLCEASGALFIVNDDAGLAAAVGAHGVHLGQSDGAVDAARRRLGADAVIGVSCSGLLERALAAEAAGASYVAFGRFYASTTKPDAPPADLGVLLRARTALHLPVCAIGGVTPDNAAPLLDAGAHMIAAVDGVFGAPDIQAAARRYATLFIQAPLQS